MTELEDDTFAVTTGVAGASDHLRGEELRNREFLGYVDLVRRHAPPGPWLDVGCGTGQLVQVASDAGIDVSGIELTPARRALAAKNTGRTIFAVPVEDVEIPSGSLAAVTMVNVFSHLVSPADTLKRIHDLLAPEGVILLQTSEAGSGLAKHHSPNWHLGDHLYFLGSGCAERYAATTGFKIEFRAAQWQPELDYSVGRMHLRGPSRAKNLTKDILLRTPGAMLLLRAYMLKCRQRDNPMYASTMVLRKCRGGDNA